MATEFTIAFRCPNCGKMSFRNTSLFEFSGRKSLISFSACKYEAMVIRTKDYRNFMLTSICCM